MYISVTWWSLWQNNSKNLGQTTNIFATIYSIKPLCKITVIRLRNMIWEDVGSWSRSSHATIT